MKNDSNSFSTLKKDSKSFSINADNFTYDECLNLINCDIPEDFFKIICLYYLVHKNKCQLAI